jgi:ketosteroid isomerase-like protein
MSRENLDALQRIYQGWAAGEIWAEAALYDPHVVYISQAGDPSPGPHYGLEAFTAYTRSFLESWDEWRIEGTDYREVGDSFVVQIRRTAVGKGSGVPIEDHAFHVWTFRGGRVIRLEVFERESEALDAVGLPE